MTKEIKRVSSFPLAELSGSPTEADRRQLAKELPGTDSSAPQAERRAAPARTVESAKPRKTPAETGGRDRRLCPQRHHHLRLRGGGNAATTTTHWLSLHPPVAIFFFFNKRRKKGNETESTSGSLKPREAMEQRTGRNTLSPPACKREPACLHPAASEPETRQWRGMGDLTKS